MIGLFTRLNGVHFALFHVEQPDQGAKVRARWRLADPSLPSSYRQWQVVEFSERIHLVQPPLAGAAIEAEWWDTSAGRYGEWRQAALLRLTRGSARFSLTAKVPVSLLQGFTAVASVLPFGVASFVFPAVSLEAGATVEVNARQVGLCLANLLLEPGVFVPRDPAMEISNLTPVLAGWDSDPGGSAVLSRCEDPPQRFFAVAGDRVPLESPLLTSL